MAQPDNAPEAAAGSLPPPIEDWFRRRGWKPHAHQRAMLAAARGGKSALLIAPTGGGKTLAGFLPSLAALADRPPGERWDPFGRGRMHTLYISPLKALAVDV
ncbi:MAG: DEAD/DEAH box helicase, partial [Alphaproteobacteria bacterium]|nr:DEAD/DEAH box helicase [Alphaproteobacteria bacterium]